MDFTDNYYPIIHDITFFLLLIAKMIYGVSAKIVYVETAFLYKALEEDIFMNSPKELDGATDEGSYTKTPKVYLWSSAGDQEVSQEDGGGAEKCRV